MEIFVIVQVIGIIAGIVGLTVALDAQEKLHKIRRELAELRGSQLPGNMAPAPRSTSPAEQKTPAALTPPAPVAPIAPALPIPVVANTAPAIKVAKTKSASSRSGVLDFVFKNVLGLTGALLALLGLVYLGYLGIFNLGPAGRSAALAVLGVVLSGAALLLRRFKLPSALRTWLSAIGGALLLVAAVGSAGLPGLQWLDNGAVSGLVLVLVAIVANATMAFLSRHQSLTSLHHLFCLAALATAPANPLILAVAVALAVVFSLFFLREKTVWQHVANSALTLAFLAFWHGRQDSGALPIALYLDFGLFIHFWLLFARPAMQVLHGQASVRSAGGLIGGLLLTGPLLLTGAWQHLSPLYAIACAVLLWSAWMQGRKGGNAALGTLTIILAGLAGLAAIISLFATPLFVPIIFILGAAWCLGFRILATRKLIPEALAGPSGLLEAGFWLGLIPAVLWNIASADTMAGPSPEYLLLALSAAGALLSRPARLPKTLIWTAWLSGSVFMVSWVSGLAGLAMAAGGTAGWIFVAMGLTAGLGLVWMESRQWLKAAHIGFGLGLLVLYCIASGQNRLWGADAGGLIAIDLTAWGLLILLVEGRLRPKWRASGLVVAASGLLALPFFAFAQDLPYLVGPLWLALAAGLGLRQALEGTGRSWRFMSVLALVLFWIHHLLVVLQSQLILPLGPWGPLPIMRLTHSALSLVVGLGVMVLMARREPWRSRNLGLIPFLCLLAIGLLVEFRGDDLALVFALTGLALFGVSRWAGLAWQGLDRGSLAFQWASILLLMAMSSSLQASHPWWQSALAIGCQVVFMGLRLWRPGLKPAGLLTRPPKARQSFIERHWTVVQILPPALGLALFCFWASTGLVLDCLWLAEAFILFALGLLLRERLLFVVSLLSVTATMAHLVFWGLEALTDPGKVFFLILTGILLMAMSLLYRRFGTQPTRNPS